MLKIRQGYKFTKVASIFVKLVAKIECIHQMQMQLQLHLKTTISMEAIHIAFAITRALGHLISIHPKGCFTFQSNACALPYSQIYVSTAYSPRHGVVFRDSGSQLVGRKGSRTPDLSVFQRAKHVSYEASMCCVA